MVVGRQHKGIDKWSIPLCDAHPRVVLSFRTVFPRVEKIKCSGMFFFVHVYDFVTSVQITLATFAFAVYLNRCMAFFL